MPKTHPSCPQNAPPVRFENFCRVRFVHKQKIYSKWLCEKDIIKLRSIVGDYNRKMCPFLVYIGTTCINITLRQLSQFLLQNWVFSVLLLADACGRFILHTSYNHVNSLSSENIWHKCTPILQNVQRCVLEQGTIWALSPTLSIF